MKVARPRSLFWAIAAGVLVLDQLTKYMVRVALEVGEVRPFIPGVLDLTYVRNVGAAFGIFPGRQPIFIATSLVVLFVVWAYWRRSHPDQWPLVCALALVTAGGAGNLIDRVVLGRVTDFLSAAFVDFPVFNVADSAITVGVAILIGWLLLTPDPATQAMDSLKQETDEHEIAEGVSDCRETLDGASGPGGEA